MKGSDGSLAHQYRNPCKVWVKADPGLIASRTLFLESRSYTFPITVLAAAGWKTISAKYKNSNGQDVTLLPPNAAAATYWQFSVAENLTESSPGVITVHFATLRLKPDGRPDYEEDIAIIAHVVPNLAVLDGDNNGFYDQWETQYFGKVGTNPNADPDGDGWTNFQEYYRGSDPTHVTVENQWLSLSEDSALFIPNIPPSFSFQILTPPQHGILSGTSSNLKYLPYANFNGSDSFTYKVTKSSQSYTATVYLTIDPTDDPPLVDAGPSQVISLPQNSAILNGTVTDIDTSTSNLSFQWKAESGPTSASVSGVIFASSTSLSTTVTFPIAGTYILRLSCSGGGAIRSDTISITVNSAGTAAPAIALESPSANATFTRPAPVTLKASLDVIVAKVEFYEGSRKIGEDVTGTWNSSTSQYQYDFTWNPTNIGTFRLSAQAVSSSGAKSLSASKIIRVVGIPNVIGSPPPGGGTDSGSGPGNNGNSTTGGNGGSDTNSTTPPGDPQADSEADDDQDGLTNAEEQALGTDPNNKNSDGDKLPDGAELFDADDAAPDDPAIRWKKSPEYTYAAIPIDSTEPTSNYAFPFYIGNDGRIAVEVMSSVPPSFTTPPVYKIWKNGTWTILGSSLSLYYHTSTDDSVSDYHTSKTFDTFHILGISGLVIEDDGTVVGTANAEASDFYISFTCAVKWDSSGASTIFEPKPDFEDTSSGSYTYAQRDFTDITLEGFFASREGKILLTTDTQNIHWTQTTNADGGWNDINGTSDDLWELLLPSGNKLTYHHIDYPSESTTGIQYYPEGITRSGHTWVRSENGNYLSLLGVGAGQKVAEAAGQEEGYHIISISEDPGGSPIINGINYDTGDDPWLYTSKVLVDGQWLTSKYVIEGEVNKLGMVSEYPHDNFWINGSWNWIGSLLVSGGDYSYPGYWISNVALPNDNGVTCGIATKTVDPQNKALPVYVFPFDIVEKDYDDSHVRHFDTEEASVPVPEVNLTVTSATPNANGDMQVHIKAVIKDGLSELIASDKLNTLQIKVNDTVMETVQNLASQATSEGVNPWQLNKYEATIERDLTIPFEGIKNYAVVRVETGANAVGKKGWSDVTVNFNPQLTSENVSPQNSPALSFSQPLSANVADTVGVTLSGQSPVPLVEPNSAPGSLHFEGVQGQGATASVFFLQISNSPAFNPGLVDTINATLTYQDSGAQVHAVSSQWTETGANTNTFKVSGSVPTFATRFVGQDVQSRRGSELGTVRPFLIRLSLPDEIANNSKVIIGSKEYSLKKLSYTLSPVDNFATPMYYVSENDKPKIFLKTSSALQNLPASVSALSPSPGQSPIPVKLKYLGKTCKVAEIKFFDPPDDENSTPIE